MYIASEDFPLWAPTFKRLLFVIAAGVGAISTIIGLGAGAPIMVVLIPSVLLMLGCIGLILHEVNRLLDDERGAQR